MNERETEKGTFLDRVRERVEKRQRICVTCGNLVRIGRTLIGCEAHDKLIIPEYPPYSGNAACPDWKP